MDCFGNVAAVRIAAGGGAVRFIEFVKRDWSEGRIYRRDRIVELFKKIDTFRQTSNKR